MDDMFKDILIDLVLQILLFVGIPIVATIMILTKVFNIELIISIFLSVVTLYLNTKNVMRNYVNNKNNVKLLGFLSLITLTSIVIILLFSEIDMLLLKTIVFGVLICLSQHILAVVCFREGIRDNKDDMK